MLYSNVTEIRSILHLFTQRSLDSSDIGRIVVFG